MRQAILILVLSYTLASGQIVFPGEEKGKSIGNSPVLRPVGPPVGSSFGSPEGPSRVHFGEQPSVKEQEHGLSDEPIDLEASNNPQHPQARFLPGLFGGGLFGNGGGLFGNGGGFGKGGGLFGNSGGFGKGKGLFGGLANIFNPCSRCQFDDLQFANHCCQRGEVQCCGYLGGAYGNHGDLDRFGHHGGGFGGGIKPGLGVKPVGPPGYIPGGHGSIGGIGGIGGGIGGIGGGIGGIKPGYCPKPTLFGGLFGGRSIGDEEKQGNKVSFRTAEEKQNIANEAEFKRERRQSNEPQVDDHHGEAPEARFLPGLGANLPGFFCRDECFSDFDCPGYLKCCINIRNCRDCALPLKF